MIDHLFILRKGKDPQTGEKREGSYAARTQIGTEKDGSPMYRYFKTVDEYKTYLNNKAGSKKDDKKKTGSGDTDLKEKTEQERKDSKRKQDKFAKEKKRSLFVKKDAKDKSKVKKSLSLYISGDK